MAHIQQRDMRFTINLTDRQKELIRNSWQALQLVQDFRSETDGLKRFSKVFYPLFFKANPAGQRLFDTVNLENQARSLTNMLTWIVSNLDNLPSLVPVLAQMGGRHEIYGVKPEEYKSFAKSIGESFKKILGNEISEEAIKAWYLCITQIAELMTTAAKKVRMGFQATLYRERDDLQWHKKWASLTLDTLFLFADPNFTNLKAQFSIKGVEQINFPKDNEYPYVFELVSTDPPFTLKLRAETENAFEDWIFEMDWRIQAIQRVYGTHNHEEDGDDSASDTDKQLRKDATRRAKKTEKKIVSRKQLATSSQEEEQVQTVGASFNEAQKQLIKKTWEKVLSSQSMVSQFIEVFWKLFFDVNPSGKRLFDEKGMESTGRSICKMIFTVINSLEHPESLKTLLHSLGGRHEIYGVEPGDYVAFSNALCDTLETILGSSNFTSENRNLWFSILMEMSTLMQVSGRQIRRTGLKGIVFRRLRKEGEWKKSAIALSFDTLYIYTNEKHNRLRSSYSLSDTVEINILPLEDNNPYKFGFSLNMEGAKYIQLSFNVETESEQNMWLEELTWRVQAVRRVFKEEDSDSTSTSMEGPEAKVRKQIKKLNKSRNKPKDK
eukprot:TRINITY_DN414_c0_g1_i1.p1 TRINITY_DN414_c0_g1~~TRINITY_DN414_c0_g1_i1.p1  ORF type:complete len:607 (-),score=123.11 TRINITY_DN414_c0_g1_i1:242-2062(-)